MRTIFFIAFIVCMCCSTWIGPPIAKALNWMMGSPPIAVLFLFLLIISIVRLCSIFMKVVLGDISPKPIKWPSKKNNNKTTQKAGKD